MNQVSKSLPLLFFLVGLLFSLVSCYEDDSYGYNDTSSQNHTVDKWPV